MQKIAIVAVLFLAGCTTAEERQREQDRKIEQFKDDQRSSEAWRRATGSNGGY